MKMQKYDILIKLRLSVKNTLNKVCNKNLTNPKNKAIFIKRKTLYNCVEVR